MFFTGPHCPFCLECVPLYLPNVFFIFGPNQGYPVSSRQIKKEKIYMYLSLHWDCILYMPSLSDSSHWLPITHYTVIFFFFLLRATPVAYGSPRLGVTLELQLPAYTAVTGTPDPSNICDLQHSSWQRPYP